MRLTQPEPMESDVLSAVRKFLAMHSAVSWVGRVNAGRTRMNVRFNDIDGCSDLIGQLRDGRFLAVEVKRPSTRNRATDSQAAFLARVRSSGGVAFVADSVDEAAARMKEMV